MFRWSIGRSGYFIGQELKVLIRISVHTQLFHSTYSCTIVDVTIYISTRLQRILLTISTVV